MNNSTISVATGDGRIERHTNIPKAATRWPVGRNRFHFKPGYRVRITRGPYEGQEAVIDTLVGVTQAGDGYWNWEVGYNVILEDKCCITVQWDRVTKIP